MKFCVVGAPLAFNISVDAEDSDSFESIFEKVQKAAGKATSLAAYDLYMTAPSSVTGELVAATGPLRSTDTPATLQLHSNQTNPHVLILVRRGLANEGGGKNHSPLRTTIGSWDACSESSITTASTSPTTMATPPATDEYRHLMRAVAFNDDPGQIRKAQVALDRHRSDEEDLLQRQMTQCGPELAPGEVEVVPTAAGEAASTSHAAAHESPPSQPASGRRAHSDSKLSYYDRLVAIYSAYRPEKLSKVKGTLRRYAGREEEVIRQLVLKYGPEPSSIGVTMAKPSFARSEEPASRFSAAQHQLPTSTSDTEASVHAGTVSPAVEEHSAASWVGASEPKEAAASGFIATARVMAAASPVTPSTTNACGAGAEETQPSDTPRGPLPTAASSLADPEPHHTAPSPALAPSSTTSTTSTTEPTAIEHRHGERLVTLYPEYNPSKPHTVEGTLRRLAGQGEGANQHLAKHGGAETRPLAPEVACDLLTATGIVKVSSTSPIASARTANAPKSSASSAGDSSLASPATQPRQETSNLREHIYAMIAAHEPEKLDRVEHILEAYRSREGEVIAKLEMRYADRRRECIAGEPKTKGALASVDSRSSLAALPVAPASTGLVAIQHSPPSANVPAEPAPLPAPGSVVSAQAATPLGSRVTVVEKLRAGRVEAAASTVTGVAQSQQSHTSQRGATLLPAHRVATAHLERAAQASLRERYWAYWRAYYAQKKAAALLQQGLWVEASADAAPRYRLNDSVEPAYTVANLDVVVAQEEGGGSVSGSHGRAFSSELQIALRALLASLRHCVESRVIEAQSSEELQVAEALVSHWSAPENLGPVTDSPELVHALHQAAHLIGQLGDLLTVIRTQAGQLQQLKTVTHRREEHVEHNRGNTEALERLQAKLTAANNHRRVLEQALKRVSTGAAENHTGRPPSRRARATSEGRKDAQIAQLQQELARTRNALFLSKEAQETMKVQLQQSCTREGRRAHEDRHRQATSARRTTPSPARATPRSLSARVGNGFQVPLSKSPRGFFSYDLPQETPRFRSTSLLKAAGRAVSSIRKLPVTIAEQKDTNTCINSSAPWPSPRYAVASRQMEMGPCPNCSTPLTSCYGEGCTPASGKAAFCFSCRRYFASAELQTRCARKVVEEL
ncbi:hypothetical protein LSCM1_00140 [Leishmania martiniquensis]|uniref:Uncharacterized protein n=1 Tax=Leishmania martiniquensis TaxID=1580590 RepID=A0A836G0N0_9TRYP|nr:hypothetical protein LSCM1_00140 [Leishmania martiniquensis]